MLCIEFYIFVIKINIISTIFKLNCIFKVGLKYEKKNHNSCYHFIASTVCQNSPKPAQIWSLVCRPVVKKPRYPP